MGSRDRKEYMRKWRARNRNKIREYDRRYKEKNPDKIKQKEIRRRQKPRRIKYMNEYSKKYVKSGEAKLKHEIRSRTNKKYGNTPKGYEKHHLDYNNPNNFVLVPLEKHKLIHIQLNIREANKNGIVNR